MNATFSEHFRCPDSLVEIRTSGSTSGEAGYFRFGNDAVCYGQTNSGKPAALFSERIHDALLGTQVNDREVSIPFDLDRVVQNLRCEYYAGFVGEEKTRFSSHPLVRNLYYKVRPLMPVGFRKILQRMSLRGKINNPFPHWPVDRSVDCLFETLMSLAIRSRGNSPIPFIWFWPDGAEAALTITHDVEGQTGRDFCERLMNLDDSFGFKSAFQIIPETRYEVSEPFLQRFRERGFEVNVHDLNHDGNLFREREEFLLRARKINEYAKHYQTSGFRSGVLYRNLHWYDAFDFSYDMSVPNVGHLDPQGGGCCTLFPYFVHDILEIPVTVTQDYSLFNILNTYSIDLWKEQCKLILKGSGLISIIVHPDYIVAERAQNTYRRLLQYLEDFRTRNRIWTTLPHEIDCWWRMRRGMSLVQDGESWKIKGEGKERARVAYAHLIDGRLVYSFDRTSAELTIPRHGQTSQSVPPSAADPHTPTEKRESRDSQLVEAGSRMNQSSTRISSQPNSTTDSGEGTAVETALLELPITSISDGLGTHPANPSPRRPLRVCMVSYSFYENDNRVLRYATTLAKRGDHVDVFALHREGKPVEEELEGVHVHRLQGRILNEKNRASYAWRICRFLARATAQVAKQELKNHYDLMHIHSVPDFMVFSGLFPKLRGTPVILDIHDILPEFYASKFASGHRSGFFRVLVGVERASCRFANHVIIANDIWRERLLSRTLSADKCTVILNSPDRSIFSRRGNGHPRSDKFLMLYPGSLNKHQGLDIAIRAVAKISKRAPQAEFHIYGDGPSKQDLLDLIKALGVESQVKIPPARSIQEIAQIMETANLGVVPKRKDNFGNEAFSTKILEFMAMGVPVVVSDTRIDKLYFDDSVVKFFSSGDEDDLARCMMEMIDNPEARKRQVENANRFVESIDWTAKQHEYLELVDRLAAQIRS